LIRRIFGGGNPYEKLDAKTARQDWLRSGVGFGSADPHFAHSLFFARLQLM
jgi:hypothetical protein